MTKFPSTSVGGTLPSGSSLAATNPGVFGSRVGCAIIGLTAANRPINRPTRTAAKSTIDDKFILLLGDFLFRRRQGRGDRIHCLTLYEPRPREEDEGKRLGPEDRALRQSCHECPDHAGDDSDPAQQVDRIAPLLVGWRLFACCRFAEQPEREYREHREEYDCCNRVRHFDPVSPPGQPRRNAGWRRGRKKCNDCGGGAGDDCRAPVVFVKLVVVAAIREQEERQGGEEADEK